MALGLNNRWSIPSPELEAIVDQELHTGICNLPNENIPADGSEPSKLLPRQGDENPQPKNLLELPSDNSIQCQTNNVEFLMSLSEERQLSLQAIFNVIVGCGTICQQCSHCDKTYC